MALRSAERAESHVSTPRRPTPSQMALPGPVRGVAEGAGAVRRFVMWSLVFGVSVLMTVSALAAPNDLVVIAAQEFPVDSLTIDDVQRIYLGRKLAIGDMPVTAIDQRETAPIKRDFLNRVLGLSHSDYRAQLLRQRFQDGAVTPKFVAGSADVLKEVWSIRGAIGYVYQSELGLRPGIKVLATIPTR